MAERLFQQQLLEQVVDLALDPFARVMGHLGLVLNSLEER